MNNQIKNEETKVETGISLNDKDYLMCLLITLKEMEKNYCTSMTEASCETLYNNYLETFLNISQLQREVYELMFRNGWYTLEKADNSKIQNKYQTLSQELKDLKN